jgi:hypothetical protein
MICGEGINSDHTAIEMFYKLLKSNIAFNLLEYGTGTLRCEDLFRNYQPKEWAAGLHRDHRISVLPYGNETLTALDKSSHASAFHSRKFTRNSADIHGVERLRRR